jgi:hypothetical protein
LRFIRRHPCLARLRTLATLLLIRLKHRDQQESCPAMSLVLSQKNTIGLGVGIRNFIPLLQNKLSRRGKAPRLRRKGPQWARIALLVIAGDILLAAFVWMAVDFFLR